jgi:hypothetical protein
MIIIGCDFHPSYQQVAKLDTETGRIEDHKLMHATREAERFYRALASPALVGIEAVGNDQWFVHLLQKLGHEVWIGDAAQIRASYVRKQNGSKGRNAYSATADRWTIPAYLDPARGDAGSSPAAHPSA